MRVLCLALLLTGCGSACSTTAEQAAGPQVPPAATGEVEPAPPADPAASAEPEPEPAPPPEPTPVDPDDLRVVYASAAPLPGVRFAVSGQRLVVVEKTSDGERICELDMFGTLAWEQAAKRVENFVVDAEAVYAIADGELRRTALSSGESTRLTEATGEVLLAGDSLYLQEGGRVQRLPKEGGAGEELAKATERAGYFTLKVDGEQLVLLASAYRNRPARNPRLGWLFTAPRAGGAFRVRTRSLYSPGPELVVSDGFAYLGGSLSASEFAYRIYRLKLDGKRPPELVVKHPIAVFALDGDQLYAAARFDDAAGIYRFPVGGGDPVQLSAFKGGASGLQVDASHVYWESRGRIYRVEK